MKAFFLSLFSRKFLLVLGLTLTFIANKQYDQALIAVFGYLGINVADTKLNNK